MPSIESTKNLSFSFGFRRFGSRISVIRLRCTKDPHVKKLEEMARVWRQQDWFHIILLHLIENQRTMMQIMVIQYGLICQALRARRIFPASLGFVGLARVFLTAAFG
jgi:hypothetical protein